MRRVICLLSLLGVVVAAGCSSSGGGNGSLSAKALSDKAINAFTSASAFHVSGTGTDSSGNKLAFDLHLGKDAARGSITVSGSQLQLLSVGGKTYFKAPDAFLRQVVPANEQAVAIALLHGKWVYVPANDPHFGSLAGFGSKQQFVAQVLQNSKTCQQCAKGPSKSVDGTSAVSFIDQKQKSTVYVPASGTPYPLEVDENGAQKGTLHFDSWNQPVSVTAPPASEVVDLSRLPGG